MSEVEITIRTGDRSRIAMGWLELDWPNMAVRGGGRPLAAQWIADPDGGILLVEFDAPGRYAVTLRPAPAAAGAAFAGRVEAAVCEVIQNGAARLGLPRASGNAAVRVFDLEGGAGRDLTVPIGGGWADFAGLSHEQYAVVFA